jgi:hypothetical protein
MYLKPGNVAHACNPTDLGDRLAGSCLEVSPGKKLARHYVNKQTEHGGTHL